MTSRRPSPRGAVLVPILCVVVGILLGVALGVVPRFFNIDPMRWIKPEAASTEAAASGEKSAGDEKDGKKTKEEVVHPKELELRRLIADVQKQRAALEEREKPLAAREAQLEQTRKSLEEMKQQIDVVEARVKKSNLEVDASELKNIKKLAKTWSQMEPTEVVALVKGLDIDLAAKVISSMQERAVAPILGAMATAADSEKLAPDLVMKLKLIKQAAEVAGATKKEKG